MWAAIVLFHEGYHLYDERVYGFGASILEEAEAKIAERGFYLFLKKKYGYFDRDLEITKDMTLKQMIRNRRTKYGKMAEDRSKYDKRQIEPRIPKLLP